MKRALVFWKYRTLFSLILCTLVLFKVHLTHAAPTSQQHTEQLSRSTINTRGSHWAVGHLMGKKSIEEYPYVLDVGERAPANIYTEGEKPVELYQQWREALLNLLQMLELSDSRNSQAMREASLYKKLWDMEDNSKVKEEISCILTAEGYTSVPIVTLVLESVLMSRKNLVRHMAEPEQKKMLDFFYRVMNLKENSSS